MQRIKYHSIGYTEDILPIWEGLRLKYPCYGERGRRGEPGDGCGHRRRVRGEGRTAPASGDEGRTRACARSTPASGKRRACLSIFPIVHRRPGRPPASPPRPPLATTAAVRLPSPFPSLSTAPSPPPRALTACNYGHRPAPLSFPLSLHRPSPSPRVLATSDHYRRPAAFSLPLSPPPAPCVLTAGDHGQRPASLSLSLSPQHWYFGLKPSQCGNISSR